MSNPLYQAMGNNQNNILSRFNQFKNNFKGDPKQQVQELLNSGRITQDQYNRAVQMANQLQRIINGGT